MTDHDPAATFQADQDAAEAEEKTREETVWELNVRNATAQALGHEAHALLLMQKGRTYKALATLITMTWLVAAVLVVLSFFGVGTW